MAIRKSSSSGIPFGNTASRPANPVTGQPFFNGQEARLELYTSNGWQNIVQETPAVVSITGQLNETTTSTITINGTNFAANCIAYVVGTNGVETPANTTTLVSVVEVTAVFPALSPANALYDVKIVNPSNLYGVLYETLGVNDAPVWSTSAGSLGTFTELDVVSVTVAATDATDSTNSAITYSLVSGSLPTGFSLNSTTGVISGTAVNTATNTTYSFTIGASDSRNTTQTRAFSISINDRSPVWTTGTVLPVFTRTVAYSTTVSATEDESGAITYSLVSGSLPTGLTLSSSGTISGTPTSSIDTSFTIRATVTASGTTADRAFTMANVGSNAPVWTTSAGALTTGSSGSAYSVQLVATDDSGTTPIFTLASGTLPTGLSISSGGLISGTPTSGNGNASFTVDATDANGTATSRSFSIPVNVTAVYTSTQTVTLPTTTLTKMLLIGGGGAGGGTAGGYSGGGGGGGGGGQVVYQTNVAITAGNYSIVIGAGADNPGGDTAPYDQNCGNGGGTSSFNGYTALGGAGGTRSGNNNTSRGTNPSWGGGGGASYTSGMSQNAPTNISVTYPGGNATGNNTGGGGGGATASGSAQYGGAGATYTVGSVTYNVGGGGHGGNFAQAGTYGGGAGTTTGPGGNATSYGGGGGSGPATAIGLPQSRGGFGYQGLLAISYLG